MNAISRLVVWSVATLVFTGCATTKSLEPTTQASSSKDLFAELVMGGRMTDADVKVVATKAQAFDLGSKSNPVRVNMPTGQRAYLSRLKCSDGTRPQFNRVGSFGAGPYGSIIDGYEMTCSGDVQDALIFMDMYHPKHQESEPVNGYTID